MATTVEHGAVSAYRQARNDEAAELFSLVMTNPDYVKGEIRRNPLVVALLRQMTAGMDQMIREVEDSGVILDESPGVVRGYPIHRMAG